MAGVRQAKPMFGSIPQRNNAGRMLNKIPLVAISILKYCEKAMITQKLSADPEALFGFQRISGRVFLTLWVRGYEGDVRGKNR